MRKNMPYMVLDITKKPGDPNAVKTGDMLLAENTKSREALKKCLARRPFSVVEIRSRRSTTPRTGKWLNGKDYEYELAYCSECGRTLWVGWDSHREAKENIRDFAEYYRYCPGCGAKMEGGEYVE